MTSLKRILVATDFSPLGNGAVRRAAWLATREDGELLIVHAMPRLSALHGAFGADDALQLPGRLRAAADANLANLIEQATQAGVRRVRGEIVEGSAHRAVAEMADAFAPELLVIGAHSKGQVQQFFLGGTASRILGHAACPVLVVRRQPEGDYRQVMAAVDLGPRSSAVLRASVVMAGPGRITAVHAYKAPFEAELRYAELPEKEIAPHTEREREAAQANMQALLCSAELAGLDLSSRIAHGHPNPVLLDTANSLSADLIVAGRHAGSHLEEAVMGSITKLLVYYAPSDVLVV